MYILSSQTQSIQLKIYRAVLDDVAKSSKELKFLLKRAKKNVFLRPKLIQIANDILKIRLNNEASPPTEGRGFFFRIAAPPSTARGSFPRTEEGDIRQIRNKQNNHVFTETVGAKEKKMR